MLRPFRDCLTGPGYVRLMGAHDGLTAAMAENAGFEAVWAGGLGISSAYRVADAGLLTMTELLDAAVHIHAGCSVPVLADVDAGFGDVNVVRRMVELYEAAGIEAVCIEDKQYPKRNSFRDGHQLEDPVAFAHKISVAKKAQSGDDFVVVARLESLIVGAGMADALARAERYHDAGADAVLIHSRKTEPNEIAEFCQLWQGTGRGAPVLCVPTTYAAATGRELADMGVKGIIYANHAVRAMTKAATDVMAAIARDDSSGPIEDRIATLAELFDLIGMNDVLGDEPWQGVAPAVAAEPTA